MKTDHSYIPQHSGQKEVGPKRISDSLYIKSVNVET